MLLKSSDDCTAEQAVLLGLIIEVFNRERSFEVHYIFVTTRMQRRPNS